MNNSEFKEGQEVLAKFKIKNPKIDRDGEIRIFNESGWVTYAKPEELVTEIQETNKVELTKVQADFLESFTYKPKALHYISRVGWDYAFTDNEEKEIDFETPKYKELLGNLENEDEIKILLLKALINGYTVEQPKLYTVEIPNNDKVYLMLIKNNEHIRLGYSHYVKKVCASSDGCTYKLTEAEIRKDFEWARQAGFAKEVE